MIQLKPIYRVLILTLLALAVGAFGGATYTRVKTQRQLSELFSSGRLQTPGSNSKLENTLRLIADHYIDTVKIDTFIESLMPEMLGRLDPHTTYIPAQDMSKMNEALDGEFDGIGVVFNMATDTVIVLNVIAGGGSAKAGVMARDRIIEINDTIVAGQSLSQDYVVSRLRGPRGTSVKLGVERGGIDELVEIEVVRDKVPINSISSSFIIKDGVGYIRLDQFSRKTYAEFLGAVAKLTEAGMESLIFDLRSNAGGFMDQAILLAGEFLPSNQLIVYTEDRAGRQDRQYSSREGSLQDLPLVVLIDEGSASSSEILAGALQDNDKGLLIGRRSFGKGLVQQQIPFSDGSAVRLTIARYYTPTGRSIQKPYVMGESEEYNLDILHRLEHEELFTLDSISFNDSLRRVTPGGRVVYGGGGIMPDIFVPLSKETLPQFYKEVVGRNILYRYTIEYSDRNRDRLASVESIADLDALLSSDKRLVDDFVEYAKREGISAPAKEVSESRSMLESQLRGYIGRNTSLGDDGFYANIYPLDDIMVRAVEELTVKK
ncbi:MAG: S41 family peptidase [Rikenellaceae bacterium]